MSMMFNKRNPIENAIDDLTRELADTRTRCRQLEELLGIGQHDALPSRNAVIARAETDAAIIRVHAQRMADRILDQAERQARDLLYDAQPQHRPAPQPAPRPDHRPAMTAPRLDERPTHTYEVPHRPQVQIQSSAAYEPWAGREQVADLWDIAPDDLDASIDRFMSTALERSHQDLLLER